MPAFPALTELADNYPLPSNATYKGGITKLHQATTGLLGTTGNAADARTALGIGDVITFRGKQINGGFTVNQLQLSGTVTLSAGQYGHDGWKAGASGCTYTVATSNNITTLTITAGSLQQVIDGAKIDGGVHCLSWTGTAQGKIGAGSYGATGINSTSLTAGSNVTVEFSTGTLSMVQFEQGTVPTPTERRPYPAELLLCQQYFWQLNGNTIYAHGQVNGSGSALIFFQFPTQMKTNPSVTANLVSVTDSGGSSISLGAVAISAGGNSTTTLAVSGATGLTAGNATLFIGASVASFIAFSARL